MTILENATHQDQETDTGYRVYCGYNEAFFWMFAQVTRTTRGRVETNLEILMPRTPLENLTVEHQKRIRRALAATTEESPSEPLSQPQDRVVDSHRLAPV